MSFSDKYTGILKGDEPIPPYFFALAPMGRIYSAAMRVRASMYRLGIMRTRKLPCRVVSVGNITAGGTGKTPMVAYLVRRLAAEGHKPAVITRGYGGSREGETLIVSDGREVFLGADEAGDEPALFTRLLPGVPVVMGSDRYRAGLLAIERFSPDVIVLDDGFQHMALHRDLNILLMDARRPLGNGRVLPAGYLREQAGAAERADIIVLTRSEGLGPEEMEASMALLSGVSGGRPVVTAAHRPSRIRDVWAVGDKGQGCLSGKSVFAFSGIADPASFALILKHLGAKIAGSRVFSDHHSYSPGDLYEIACMARAEGAELAVTTEKDAVKLARLLRPEIDVFSVGVELELTGGEDILGKMLSERLVRG